MGIEESIDLVKQYTLWGTGWGGSRSSIPQSHGHAKHNECEYLPVNSHNIIKFSLARLRQVMIPWIDCDDNVGGGGMHFMSMDS